MFDSIYNQIYYLGLQTIRYGKRFFKWLFSLLLKPVKAIGTLVFTAVIVIDKFALKAFHEIMADFRELAGEAKRVSTAGSDSPEGEKRISLAKLKRYFVKAVSRYKRAFIYVLNIVLPLVSLAFLLYVISTWSSVTFALEITYNGKVIGYVRSEAEYKQAREQALDRLDLGAASVSSSQDGEKEIIGQAEYEIKPVKLSQINDSVTICDKLIEESDSKITNACGIYVDNNFICAVKNETDALSVFDSILAEHETDEENAVVSFVEDIEYVQGLYPDNENIVRDAAYLSDKLH